MSETKNKPVSIGLVVLMTSIALNGILAGLLIAKKSGPHHMEPSHAEHQQMSMPNDPRRLLMGLTKERRKEVMKKSIQTLGTNGRKQHRQLMLNIRTARKSVDQQFSAQPIDARALKLSMEKLVEARSALNEASNAFIITIMQELTPEERQAALKAVQTPRKNKRPNRRKDN